MIIHAKVIDIDKGLVLIPSNADYDKDFFESQGYELKDVEQGYNGNYYLLGKTPIQPLSELKIIKTSEIEEAKTLAEFSDFTFNGITIQADEKSQMNIQAQLLAISLKQLTEVTWVTADNQVITMKSSDFVDMAVALSERVTKIVLQGRSLKDKINKATTKKQVEAIKWEEIK